MNRTEKSIRNAFFSTVESMVVIVLPFILRTALLNTLGEKYLGINNLFHSILNILTLAELGFGSSLAYSLYKSIANKDDEKVCALIKLCRSIYTIIGLFILFVGICIIPFLSVLIKGSVPDGVNITIVYIIYLLEIVINYLFFAYKTALLSALQRSDLVNRTITIVQISISLIRFFVLIIFKNYYLFIIFIPISAFLNKYIVNIISKKKYPQYFCKGKVDKKETLEIIDMVKNISFHKFGDVITKSVGSIVISSSIGLTSLAIYGNYEFVVSSVLSILNSIMIAVIPSLGNSLILESKERNFYIFNKINSLNQWFMCCCAVCIFCLTQNFMYMWAGEHLMGTQLYVAFFVVYFYLSEMRKITEIYRSAGGIWLEDRLRPFVSGIANIILSVIFVKKYDSIGVLISLIICYFFIDIPWETKAVFNSSFNENVKVYYKTYIKNVFVTFISTVSCYFIFSTYNKMTISTFFIKGIVCMLVTNIFYYLFYKKDIYFNENIKMILSIINEKYIKIIKR